MVRMHLPPAESQVRNRVDWRAIGQRALERGRLGKAHPVAGTLQRAESRGSRSAQDQNSATTEDQGNNCHHALAAEHLGETELRRPGTGAIPTAPAGD